jgi:hypothetical protein
MIGPCGSIQVDPLQLTLSRALLVQLSLLFTKNCTERPERHWRTKIWSTKPRKAVQAIRTGKGHKTNVKAVAFDGTEARFYALSKDLVLSGKVPE